MKEGDTWAGEESVCFVTDFDHICEFRFQGGSSDQQAVQSFNLHVVSCVFGVGTASIEDSHFIRFVDVFAQSLPEPGENFEGLLGGGADAGSDGPDGFVGQDDVTVPVGAILGEGSKERFELVVKNFPGLVAVSF